MLCFYNEPFVIPTNLRAKVEERFKQHRFVYRLAKAAENARQEVKGKVKMEDRKGD
jgi:hypothetical protein